MRRLSLPCYLCGGIVIDLRCSKCNNSWPREDIFLAGGYEYSCYLAGEALKLAVENTSVDNLAASSDCMARAQRYLSGVYGCMPRVYINNTDDSGTTMLDMARALGGVES